MTAAETPAEPAKPPLLARLPLEAGALAALTSKVMQFKAAQEQALLATASMSSPKASPEHDKLAQQWQVCVHSHQFCLSTACGLAISILALSILLRGL